MARAPILTATTRDSHAREAVHRKQQQGSDARDHAS